MILNTRYGKDNGNFKPGNWAIMAETGFKGLPKTVYAVAIGFNVPHRKQLQHYINEVAHTQSFRFPKGALVTSKVTCQPASESMVAGVPEVARLVTGNHLLLCEQGNL